MDDNTNRSDPFWIQMLNIGHHMINYRRLIPDTAYSLPETGL